MDILVIIPTEEEYQYFLESCTEGGYRLEQGRIGRLPVARLPDLGIVLSRGGLGKVQFAVHTRHLLDARSDWDLVIFAGAAGALIEALSVGDVVVSTEIIEHDIRNKFGKPLLPRFSVGEEILSAFRTIRPVSERFRVHFGPIASGDEDVIEAERKQALRELTGGIAIAWEGAGGARACQFDQTPFVEIRAISDTAEGNARTDFEQNLRFAMKNIVTLITAYAIRLNQSEPSE